MIKVAEALNSFAPVAQQANVSPEEPIFVLTGPQLKDIVEEATKSLQDRIEALEVIGAHQDEIKAKFEALEKDIDSLAENDLNELRLINDLRNEIIHNKPSTTETERATKIEKLCLEAPGHMISLPELRGRLGIDKAVLSRLLKRIDHDRFCLRKSKTDKRIRYLVCLSP